MTHFSIQSLLQEAQQQLSSIDSARIDSEILLAHTLKKARSFLYAFPEQTIDPTRSQEFLNYIRRRQQGEPVAYITGEQEFWSLSFKVTPAVLIPRPDTELLIETVLERIKQQAQFVEQKTLIDLGTGSGCIAIAIAKELPDWQISACDLSTDALSIAKENAKRLNLQNIQFTLSNWFSGIPDNTRFDVIVSNPPYIDAKDPALESHVAKHEPRTALIARDNGLAAYQDIIASLEQHTYAHSIVAFEIGFQQGQALKNYLNTYKDVQIAQDLQGHDRVISGLIS